METIASPGAGVTADELTAIEDAIRAAEPAYLADLERLVNIDCGSYTPAGVEEVATFVAGFLAGLGAEVVTHPDPDGRLGPTIVGTVRGAAGAGPRVLLIGHMDTVFDPGTAAERPFRIEGGQAFGPGVTDMKSGLLTGLYGLRALIELTRGGGLPFERIVFVANPDEEIGSPSSSPHIRALAPEADACFVLECARANGDIVSSRKGTLDLVLTVHGRAAHAGVEPEKGRSAILEAARIVRDLHALNGRWPGVTVNAGVISGGTRPNVVAERCVLEVDVRATDAASQDEAEAAIRALAAATEVPDTTVEVERRARHRPMEKLERSGRLVDHAGGDRGAARLRGQGHRDRRRVGREHDLRAWAFRPSTASGRSAATITRRRSTWTSASVVPRTALFAGLLLAVARDPAFRERRG